MKIIERIITGICIIGILIGMFILFCYMHKNTDGLYQMGNKYYLEAKTDDLSPDIKKGDLVIVKKIDPKEYHINNVIAYYTSDSSGNMDIEITKIVDGYTNKKHSSYIYTIEKNNKKIEITSDDIIGEWTNKKITNGYKYINILFTRSSFLYFTIIPLIVLLLLEYILLVKDYLNRNKVSYNK